MMDDPGKHFFNASSAIDRSMFWKNRLSLKDSDLRLAFQVEDASWHLEVGWHQGERLGLRNHGPQGLAGRAFRTGSAQRDISSPKSGCPSSICERFLQEDAGT